jgi:hypothetical protein
MTLWLRVHSVPQVEHILQSQLVRASSHSCSCSVLPNACGSAGTGSPFDTGFTAIQSLFTGTIAKIASLGYGFGRGEPGARKAPAGVAAGTGIAVLAVNVLGWLWGV